MKRVFITSILLSVLAIYGFAQTTEFTYQGSLKDGINAANGNFDFQFLLFDASTGGSQIFTTLSRPGVTVSNGTFTTRLDFDIAFPGANRYLEIRVRQTGVGAFTTLSPRERIGTAPYAIRAINADNAFNLGGLSPSNYVWTSDPRMSDARNPLPSSPNYVQNTTSQQVSSNFNVSGNGTVGGTLSAGTQFNIGNTRFLAPGADGNVFVGFGSGAANPTSGGNTFVGGQTGFVNSTGFENTFVGSGAGSSNTTGALNSFFGALSGVSTTTGTDNSFFGNRAGFLHTTGSFNSYFGLRAGDNSDTGNRNSLFGAGAGRFTSSGNSNSFFGFSAGDNNGSGSFNVAIGDGSDISPGDLTNAVAIGANSMVGQSNSIVLGSIFGVNGATADSKVGIGTIAPVHKLHVSGGGIVRARINSDSNAGIQFALNDAAKWSVANVSPGHFQIFNDAIGQNALLIDTATNAVTVNFLGAAGSNSLCRNASGQISSCSSSIRYKRNINPFSSGLDLINRLRPATFNWKADDMEDVGLIAEEVASAEPLLVTRNNKGEIEGVKYDRIGVVLINAVKEQQAQIEARRNEIERLRTEVSELKKLIMKGKE